VLRTVYYIYSAVLYLIPRGRPECHYAGNIVLLQPHDQLFEPVFVVGDYDPTRNLTKCLFQHLSDSVEKKIIICTQLSRI
jgi:hypothetical protein